VASSKVNYLSIGYPGGGKEGVLAGAKWQEEFRVIKGDIKFIEIIHEN